MLVQLTCAVTWRGRLLEAGSIVDVDDATRSQWERRGIIAAADPVAEQEPEAEPQEPPHTPTEPEPEPELTEPQEAPEGDPAHALVFEPMSAPKPNRGRPRTPRAPKGN